MIRIYNGLKKVDRQYQVELEILYSILPSLLNNSQNLQQGIFRRVQSRLCPLGFEGALTFTTPPG
jgi:hypothetical protein